MNYTKLNIIDETKILIDQLNDYGFKLCSEKIKHILESTFTSGEAFMGIRWILKEVLCQERGLPEQLRKRINLIIFEINKTNV